MGIYNFPPVGVPVVDSCRIFFAKEQRTLGAALVHYCGRTLVGAGPAYRPRAGRSAAWSADDCGHMRAQMLLAVCCQC